MNDTATGTATSMRPHVEALGAVLVRDVERYLCAAGVREDEPAVARRLVTVGIDELVRAALAEGAAAQVPVPVPEFAADGVTLPRGLWRVLPDRLLSLHPARRSEAVARLRITPARHLALTAQVLEEWGWARTGDRLRTRSGRRCILGAQRVVFQLGYGTEYTATTAGDHLNTVLRARGIPLPYPRWNEQPHVTRTDTLTLLHSAAALAAGA